LDVEGITVDIIIVRRKSIHLEDMLSAYSVLCNELACNSSDELMAKHGILGVMKKLFDEDVENEDLESSVLYKSYLSAVESKKDNEDFIVAHRLGEDFAVHMDEDRGHIYLNHLIPLSLVYPSIIPWLYVGTNKFIGHMWNEEKEEIIADLFDLTIIDFMKKYKCL